MGFGKFLEVMEIDNAIFQDLESVGKRKVFQIGSGKVLYLRMGKLAKYAKMDISLCCMKHCICSFYHL